MVQLNPMNMADGDPDECAWSCIFLWRVSCCTVINPTSMSQVASILLQQLDVSEHSYKTPLSVSLWIFITLKIISSMSNDDGWPGLVSLLTEILPFLNWVNHSNVLLSLAVSSSN
jgi:hypothetical protein